ncbi:MAG: NAD(P)-dependent oxidoreductase [Nitriliruptorales bacterium]|nr:NAD(P)-dependent oxidoreductase [Nitriliruptorales bacterium]
MTTVAFIGLGSQGAPIAAHLAPAGFETRVFDVVEERMEAAAATGAVATSSSAEAAAGADVIEVCVPEDDHVRDVITGPGGVLESAPAGAVIAIHSTVLPDTVIAMAEAAAERGIHVIDACVTGGPARAITRDIAYLVGGSDEAVDLAEPVLAATSKEILRAGELGNGARLKLCVNVLTYIQWAAAYESFAMAKAVGLPVEIFEEAGRSNGQLTDLQRQFLALHKIPDEVRESEDAQRNLRGFQAIAEKDLRWALRLADDAELDLPVSRLVATSMARIYGVSDATGG